MDFNHLVVQATITLAPCCPSLEFQVNQVEFNRVVYVLYHKYTMLFMHSIGFFRYKFKRVFTRISFFANNIYPFAFSIQIIFSYQPKLVFHQCLDVSQQIFFRPLDTFQYLQEEFHILDEHFISFQNIHLIEDNIQLFCSDETLSFFFLFLPI